MGSSIPYDFVQQTDKKTEFTVLSDTDSMFIHIPNIKPKTGEEAVQYANKISKDINAAIEHYMVHELLPKLGIDPKYNRTEFKTELVMDGILLLDVKKNYAYSNLAKEGKVFETPVIKYTGLSVVKTDQSQWSKDFIKQLIENVILNPEFRGQNPIPKIQELAVKMQQKIVEDINNYDFKYIGVPRKWGTKYKEGGKEVWNVTAMKLYNSIINERVLTPMSSCLVFPIKIQNPTLFETRIAGMRSNSTAFIGNTAITNLSYLAVPYNYDVERVKKAMQYFTITIDPQTVWDKICNKTIRAICDVQKNTLRTGGR